MVKKISLFLAIVLMLSLLVVPVSAEETINDLKKIYNNLQAHLHIPYYKDSEKFPAYSQTMEEIKALLNSDAITQAEISQYYNDLRTVYSELMRDTYDYSSLEKLLLAYDSLKSSVFTPESWKKLLSVRDAAQKELSSPTLFTRKSDVTAKQYADYTQSHIQTYTDDFSAAFNDLDLVEKPELMTKEYLEGYKAYIAFCSREVLLGETKAWSALQDALRIADETLLDEEAGQTQLETAYLNLSTAYSSASSEAYPFLTSKKIIDEFESLSPEDFSEASWERYKNEIDLIKEKTDKTPFFFVPIDANKENSKKFLDKYQESFVKDYEKLQNILVPIETYNELAKLCKDYKKLTAIDGLTIKMNYLKSAVKNGETVLNNKVASLKDFETAIDTINTAKEDLDLAEKFLLEEQSKVKKEDSPAAKLILILTVCVLILSFVAAIFLSRHYFGKVNWRR